MTTITLAQAQKLKPSFIRGNILHGHYDDLLTAGLGRVGLAPLGCMPPFNDPQPTTAEIRRNAVVASHLGLIDRTPGAGYGTLYGPGIVMDADGKSRATNGGVIPGDEYLAYAADSDEPDAVVTLMVQIPDDFDEQNPCIVTAPSSGSRGIYGGVAAAGEWALQHRCAVAYTDKGTGIGVHDLDTDIAYLINGLSDGATLGAAVHFRVSPFVRRTALEMGLQHRLAFKHAHSGTNAEAHWGRDVLLAIQFAFFVLNLKYDRFAQGKPFSRNDVAVIASGISNGAGASLRAVEEDVMGWIDGFALGEPAIQPESDLRIKIEDRGIPVAKCGLPILDYMSFLAIYQPAVADRPLPTAEAGAKAWREELAKRGLLSGNTDDERSENAQEKIRAHGILKDQEALQYSHSFLAIPVGVSVTYASAYGYFRVDEPVCSYSFARTDNQGKPIPLTDSCSPLYPHLFAYGNGVPPYMFRTYLPPVPAIAAAAESKTGTANTAEAAKQEPTTIRISILLDGQAADKMTDIARAVDGVLALRRVVTGDDAETKQVLSPEERRQHERIAKGMQEVRATGRLHGKPGIIVHGRADAVIAPNHTSRAYVALNQLVEGSRSGLRYVEVTNTHHFDALNTPFNLAKDFNSLHPYLLQALSWMRDHLAGKKALPPSQVVATTSRGVDQNGQPRPIDPQHPERNLPPISAHPGENEIKFDHMTRTLIIPEGQPPFLSSV